MNFASDNTTGIHPHIVAAIAAAAGGRAMPYGADEITRRVERRLAEVFERDCAVFLVGTGAAANSLALATLVPPWGAIYCHPVGHINADECGAPEFYTHGAKLALIDGDGAKVTADALKAKLAATPGGVHWAQPHALSITNATEYGRIYAPDEVAALGEIAKAHGLGFHMDGARFANAIVTLGCAPADVTWRAGIDVLSFGFTKNGGMSAECLVYFDRDKAKGVAERRKRAGHLLSKGRYMAAQIVALLQDGVWLDNARAANAGAQKLGAACGARLFQPVEANEVFARMTPDEAARLRAQGFDFYDWAEGEVRFVVSWDQPAAEIEAFAAAIAAL